MIQLGLLCSPPFSCFPPFFISMHETKGDAAFDRVVTLLLGKGKKDKKKDPFAPHSCDSVLTQKEVCHLLNHRNHFLWLFGLFWRHQARACPALTLA